MHLWPLTCQIWLLLRRCGRCSCAREAQWPAECRPLRLWSGARTTQWATRSSLEREQQQQNDMTHDVKANEEHFQVCLRSTDLHTTTRPSSLQQNPVTRTFQPQTRKNQRKNPLKSAFPIGKSGRRPRPRVQQLTSNQINSVNRKHSSAYLFLNEL